MALITKLNNIATAIGHKTGQPASTYNIDNMPSAIESIVTDFPTPTPPVSTKQVRFFDYDGTLITQMSIDEAHELTALPPVPTHTGMTAIGWTETLDTIQNLTHAIDVGMMYVWTTPSLRATAFRIFPRKNETVSLSWNQTVADSVTIDWGDGSTTQTVSSTGNVYASHQYTTASANPYIITMDPAEGQTFSLGHGSQNSYAIYGNSQQTGFMFDVFLGDCSVNNYSFGILYGLRYAASSNLVRSIDNNAFRSSGLQFFVWPTSITDLTNKSYIFAESALRRIVIPSSFTGNLANYMFYQSALYEFVASDIRDASDYMCMNARALTRVVNISPNSANQAFNGCFNLVDMIVNKESTPGLANRFWGNIPMGTMVFEDRSAFTSSAGLPDPQFTKIITLDFTKFTQVPTVASSGFFNNLRSEAKILVPSTLYNDWIAASNWSTVSSQIVSVTI